MVAVEGYGDVHLLRGGPQGIVVAIVDGTAVDHVRREHERDGVEVVNSEARFGHRQVDVLQRDQRRALEPLGTLLAEVSDPAVPRAAHRRGEGGLEAIDVDRLRRPRPEQDADVDALDVHGLERLLGERAAMQALRPGAAHAE